MQHFYSALKTRQISARCCEKCHHATFSTSHDQTELVHSSHFATQLDNVPRRAVGTRLFDQQLAPRRDLRTDQAGNTALPDAILHLMTARIWLNTYDYGAGAARVVGALNIEAMSEPASHTICNRVCDVRQPSSVLMNSH